MCVDFSADEIRNRLGISTLAINFLPNERLDSHHIENFSRNGICSLELFGGFDPNDQKHLKQIRSEADNFGIKIVSIHGPGGKFSSAYPDGITEDERKQALEAAKIKGEAALVLGAGILVCHFGTTYTSACSVLDLIDHFKGTPLILGGENVGKAVSSLKDSDSVADFVEFTKKIDSQQFKMVLDIGHARDLSGRNPFFADGSAYETTCICRDCLVHGHLHDGFTKHLDHHYPPFDGEVRWVEIFKAFREINYQGCYMFEPVYENYSPSHQNENVIEKVGSFPENFMAEYRKQSNT